MLIPKVILWKMPTKRQCMGLENLENMPEFLESMLSLKTTEDIPQIQNGSLDVIKEINQSNIGTLPDFGNFCIKGSANPAKDECEEWYDRYQGVTEMMPYAFAVSAKSNDFDQNGDEQYTDYTKMLKIVKDANYRGHIGIEYEGSKMSEEDGILATKNLMINVGKSLG